MNKDHQLELVRVVQKLYPNQAVSINVNVSSMRFMDETIETFDYRLSVHRDGNFTISEAFQSLVDLSVFIHKLQAKSWLLHMDILNEATEQQVKKFEDKNRISKYLKGDSQ